MEKVAAIRGIVDIVHKFHDGFITLDSAKQQTREIFQFTGSRYDKYDFDLAFPVFIDYFFNPAIKARAVISERNISKSDLLAGHRFIRESKLLQEMFFSNYYPRSLLVRSAAKILAFIKRNPEYLLKISRRELVGPMILEIHPTNAMCTYRCQMCIWCGGSKQTPSLADLYRKECLLDAAQWHEVLIDARNLGTQQIIFSGGGETLLSHSKFKSVLDKANSLGFETMIYTNGRMLCELDSSVIDSILNSSWLRISLHAATPEIYSRLVYRPIGAKDLEFVIEGMKKIINLKNKSSSQLEIGIGLVLQNLNYAETPNIVSLCSAVKVDFLDIRLDCIGLTKKITGYRYKQMLSDLKLLRNAADNGEVGFNLTFSDDLLIAMDQWHNLKISTPARCLIPVIRPAIDPFGIVGACDTFAEPYTRSNSPQNYILGQIKSKSNFKDIMYDAVGKEIGIDCKYCKPGQISLNALLDKLIDDLKIGVKPENQAFCFEISK